MPRKTATKSTKRDDDEDFEIIDPSLDEEELELIPKRKGPTRTKPIEAYFQLATKPNTPNVPVKYSKTQPELALRFGSKDRIELIALQLVLTTCYILETAFLS